MAIMGFRVNRSMEFYGPRCGVLSIWQIWHSLAPVHDMCSTLGVGSSAEAQAIRFAHGIVLGREALLAQRDPDAEVICGLSYRIDEHSSQTTATIFFLVGEPY